MRIGAYFMQKKYLLALTALCMISTDSGMLCLAQQQHVAGVLWLLGTILLYMLALYFEDRNLAKIKLQNQADNLKGIVKMRESVRTLHKATIEIAIIVLLAALFTFQPTDAPHIISVIAVLAFLVVFEIDVKSIYAKEIEAIKP